MIKVWTSSESWVDIKDAQGINIVHLTVDDKEIAVSGGQTILEAVIRIPGIGNIPALCYHPSIKSYGSCRLCTVEVSEDGGSTFRFVAACLCPVKEGLVVKTSSERVRKLRKGIIELLLARCPDSEVIQEKALQAGVAKTRFTKQKGNNKCILCANCARTCEEVVGVAAISLARRGVARELTTPFNEDFSEVCIGCGSCAYSCPTGAITMEDTNGHRVIQWPHNRMEFKMKKCSACGKYWAPEKQIEYIAKISGTHLSDYEVCPDCRE